ncbi:hypothetical protein Poli38472_002681 [Pythium oligandrum]|uniref:Uncharacterized protein n=1 Tax=Pythium oligandrum TaxID=41045 RepID=A0A8K1CJB1_PYTOL|nr:hypothetical protein Poli38472_002681 [Pythium oligandrum]|eukprot:TMW63740.1 hypothetical protein Poli38472_002681 [Pythium oligandrum]
MAHAKPISSPVASSGPRSSSMTAPPPRCGPHPVTYGKSWADDIQKYQAAKAILPWLPEQQTPVKHVTRYEKSREERKYDLVLAEFRDAEREVGLQKNEDAKRKQDLEHSRAKQLRNVQRFNLINHAPMYSGARDPKDPPPHETRTFRKTTNVDYNIVTNLVSSNNTAAEPTSPTRSPAKYRTRDFSILTNKYHSNHEERAQIEQQHAKEVAAVKFYKTHNYDPVRITYFDPDKETEFLERRHQEQQVHGKDRVFQLPPREQFSEGRLYNILNQKIINPEQISRFENIANRATNKMQKTAYEKRMRDVGRQQVEQDEERCLNRYAHERHEQSYVHGFDPISNEPFQGINAKPRMPLRTHSALPAWEVLEQGVASTNKVAVKRNALASSESSVNSAPERLKEAMTPSQRANIMVVEHSSQGAKTTVRL